MYTLIMTIFLVGSSNQGAAAIHSVPGFKSVEQCTAAATAWENQQPRWSDKSPMTKVRTLCVQQ